MKLTLEYVDIKDIQFADATKVENGTLYINADELKAQILQDPFIKDVNLDICRPGENVRVINIVDAIEPRVKVDNNANWCGILSPFDEFTGRGTSRCLKGISILILDSNHVYPGGRFGTVDMCGPRAELSPYAKMCNLAIECIKADDDNISHWDFSTSIRKACYAAGVYLAKAALSVTPDRQEILDNETVNPDLPNVGYYQQCYAAQYQFENVPEPIYYGFTIPDSFPLLIQPQEVIDGAIAYGYGYHQAETYAQQNHSIIMGLMRRHGKDLNFRGMMIGTTNTDDHRRRLASMMAANTFKDVLHCDGVILTKAYGGASHVCEGSVASACEKRGIMTVPTMQALNEHTNLSNEMLFDDQNLQSIVHTGMHFQHYDGPKVDKVIGHNPKEFPNDIPKYIILGHEPEPGEKIPDFPADLYIPSLVTSPGAPQSIYGPNTDYSVTIFGFTSQIGNSYVRGMDY